MYRAVTQSRSLGPREEPRKRPGPAVSPVGPDLAERATARYGQRHGRGGKAVAGGGRAYRRALRTTGAPSELHTPRQPWPTRDPGDRPG